MVHKICNIKDIEALPSMDEQMKDLIYHYVKVLSTEYGEDRNIDGDGGFVLYVPSQADQAEIKACFDYTRYTPEYVDLYGHICSSMYLLDNDYCVTVLTMLENTPNEILNELDYKGE